MNQLPGVGFSNAQTLIQNNTQIVQKEGLSWGSPSSSVSYQNESTGSFLSNVLDNSIKFYKNFFNFFVATLKFEKHYNAMALKEVLQRHPSSSDQESFFACCDDEGGQERLKELVRCPITTMQFKEPVLLSSGHTIEKKAALEILKSGGKNPFTREDFEFQHDEFTLLLIKAISLKTSQTFPVSEEAKVTLEGLLKQECYIEEPLTWCRLLSVLMPQNHYYVRRKGENHFVLEARLPINPTEENELNPWSVLRVSFFILADGSLKLKSLAEDRQFSSLDLLVKSFGKGVFKPLSRESRLEIEDSVGKEALLKNTHHTAVDSEKRNKLINVIDILELRMNDQTAVAQVMKNAVYLFRSSISPTSLPSFTCLWFDSKEKIAKKMKVAFHNGDLYELLNYDCRKVNDQIEIRMGKNLWKKISDLNQTSFIEKSICEEYQKSINFSSHHDKFSLFVLNPDEQKLVWNFSILKNLSMYSPIDEMNAKPFTHLDRVYTDI